MSGVGAAKDLYWCQQSCFPSGGQPVTYPKCLAFEIPRLHIRTGLPCTEHMADQG